MRCRAKIFCEVGENDGAKMPGRNLYDWDALFKRRSFPLVRGKDFRCSQSVMVQQIRNAASQRGLHLTITEGDGWIMVKVLAERRGRCQVT